MMRRKPHVIDETISQPRYLMKCFRCDAKATLRIKGPRPGRVTAFSCGRHHHAGYRAIRSYVGERCNVTIRVNGGGFRRDNGSPIRRKERARQCAQARVKARRE
jgi:hypothetical protein